MSSNKLRKLLNEVHKSAAYDAETEIWKIIDEIVEELTKNDPKDPSEEWLCGEEFINKYSIGTPHFLNKFYTCSTEFRRDCCKKDEEGVILYNPKKTFKYIKESGSYNTKLFSRLRKNNFFGINLEE